MLLISVDNRANKLVPDDITFAEITIEIPFTVLSACNASTRPDRLLEGNRFVSRRRSQRILNSAQFESTT